jgi:hypothetical protein
MTTSPIYLVAQQHINDLLREARHAQQSAQLRPKRRLTIALSRLRRRRPRAATA